MATATKRKRVTQTLNVSVVPNEIVFAGAEISVTSEEPLDPEIVRGAIQIKNRRGQVLLNTDGRTARYQTDGTLPAGYHTLIVGELVTKDGRRISDEQVVPFYLTDSNAKIDSKLRVESMVRLRVGKLGTERLSSHQRPSGKYVEFMKAVDRNSGVAVELAFDQDGQAVSRREILNAITEARVKKFGKLHPALFDAAEKAESDDRIEVALWVKTTDTDQSRFKLAGRVPEEIPQDVIAHRKRRRSECDAVAEKLAKSVGGQKVRTDPAGPVVYARMTPGEIRRAAQMNEVLGIFLHEAKGVDDLSNSLAIANSDDVHATGIKGSGIKVAVWEQGPDNTSNLTITAFFDPSQSQTSDHARHTCGIVKNKQANAPKGHAPSCSLHSANDYDLDALAWAVEDKNCTVISQSFHRDSEQTNGDLSFDDIYKDNLVLHYPFPTILQAAGNGPDNEFVNHKGFNSLAVGNHNDSAGAMASDSCFRNPNSSHNDRELPEISANGTSVTTVGLTKSGTSMAAPAAAGVTALLQEKNTTLKSWPEGCRAILLAGSTKNVTGSTWWSDVVANNDAVDGSGAVNAEESINIVASRKSRNASASQRGWDVGTLVSSDFGANGLSTFSYKVKVPNLILGPRRVKVALAWDSKITALNLFGVELLLGSTLTVDFDLKIFDSNGNQVGYSGSFDNSYEIAEFTGNAGAEYTIRIRRWSGSDSSWYGIAWTVTGGILLNPIPLTPLQP